MTYKQSDILALGASAGVLASSFLAFATTMSGSAYISITHMSGMFYLLPVLGLIALVFSILSLGKRLDAKFAAPVLGIAMLGVSAFSGIQARAQLDGFVYMQYEIQASRARFNADFNARRAAIEETLDKGFPSSDGSAQAATSPPPTPEIKPIVVSEADSSTWGAGFYLSVVASLLLAVSRGFSFIGKKDQSSAPL